MSLPNQKYAITQYSKIPTQSLNQAVYSYAAVKTASPVKMSELRTNRGFTTSVAVLMKGYSHFLTNPQIKDILVTEN